MKLSDRIALSPDYQTGGWIVDFDEQRVHFTDLDTAIEMVLEFSLVIAIDNVAEAKSVKNDAVLVKDAIEAFRQMIMTWFQTQIPDPHEQIDLNRIN